MANLTKSGNVTLEELKNKLQSKLNSQHNFLLKGSRLEVVLDTLRGCIIKVKQKGNDTDVFLGPFVPSTGLAVVMSLLCVGGAVLLMLYVNVILGAILLPLSMFARILPSSGLVNEVKIVLEGL